MNANNIIDLESLKYHFYRQPSGKIVATIPFSAMDNADDVESIVGVVDEEPVDASIPYGVEVFNDDVQTATDIRTDFQMFKDGRPEYSIISKTWLVNKVRDFLTVSEISDNVLADMRETYITLLQGTALLRAARNGVTHTGKVLTKLARVLQWLDGTDFYIAPASTKWHDSFKGGLLLHSLTVAARIIELAEVSVYSNKVHLEDAILCALVHDWCKINKYEQFMRNQKNEETGQWEKVPSYKYREDIMVPLGHGEASMYIAMKMFNLSQEEAVAIRNHMGKWAADNSYNITDLQYANENYPLNLLLQFADQIACVKF